MHILTGQSLPLLLSDRSLPSGPLPDQWDRSVPLGQSLPEGREAEDRDTVNIPAGSNSGRRTVLPYPAAFYP